MDFNLALTVLKQEILSFKSLLLVVTLALFFIMISLVIINIPTISSIILNDYPIIVKLNIISLIILGSFSATSRLDLFMVSIMGILFGLNMTLLINKYNALKRRGNLRIMAGTGIISVFAAGCASCGLSFASIIGISAVIALLPFGGIELYILAIGILLISLYFNLKQIIKVCKIN